jgi:hypothetical protein
VVCTQSTIKFLLADYEVGSCIISSPGCRAYLRARVDKYRNKFETLNKSALKLYADLRLGEKCGATFIDGNFKAWLRDILGGYYSILDPSTRGRAGGRTEEGPAMRDLMRTFDGWKKTFSRESGDVKFYLPEGPLHELDILNVLSHGELTIKR